MRKLHECYPNISKYYYKCIYDPHQFRRITFACSCSSSCGNLTPNLTKSRIRQRCPVLILNGFLRSLLRHIQRCAWVWRWQSSAEDHAMTLDTRQVHEIRESEMTSFTWNRPPPFLNYRRIRSGPIIRASISVSVTTSAMFINSTFCLCFHFHSACHNAACHCLIKRIFTYHFKMCPQISIMGI